MTVQSTVHCVYVAFYLHVAYWKINILFKGYSFWEMLNSTVYISNLVKWSMIVAFSPESDLQQC